METDPITESNNRKTGSDDQRKLSHLAELATGLAHEIRNPLTTIGALAFAIQRKLPDGTQEYKDAVVIRKEINRVNEILKDFIQLARPASPKLRRMSAKPLLQEISDLLTSLLRQQGIDLACEFHGHAYFKGDPHQLKQVLINLVHNAAESMEAHGKISIRTRDAMGMLKGNPTEVVIIEVEDNGPGISPEVQQRLFEPFFSTKSEGTGLGLPISARIIAAHGGVLEFESQVGQGTIFRILLPEYEADS
jgi:two-component system sensor histidine kinase AtoS